MPKYPPQANGLVVRVLKGRRGPLWKDWMVLSMKFPESTFKPLCWFFPLLRENHANPYYPLSSEHLRENTPSIQSPGTMLLIFLPQWLHFFQVLRCLTGALSTSTQGKSRGVLAKRSQRSHKVNQWIPGQTSPPEACIGTYSLRKKRAKPVGWQVRQSPLPSHSLFLILLSSHRCPLDTINY